LDFHTWQEGNLKVLFFGVFCYFLVFFQTTILTSCNSQIPIYTFSFYKKNSMGIRGFFCSKLKNKIKTIEAKYP